MKRFIVKGFKNLFQRSRVNFITLEKSADKEPTSLMEVGTYLARMKDFSSNARCVKAQRTDGNKGGTCYQFLINYVDESGERQHYVINAAAIITADWKEAL